MTALTRAPLGVARIREPRAGFGNLLRSEAIKVLTLRSTWWSLGIAAALSVTISLLLAVAALDTTDGLPAATLLTAPMQFTMLVAGIFGTMAITGECSTGMIRSTLTAAPRRGAVLLAKALVVSIMMATTTAVAYVITSVTVLPLTGMGMDLADPAASLVPLALGIAAMVAFSLIGLGSGFLVRNGAGAIAVTVGVLFVLPIVVTLFAFVSNRWQWILDSAQYLPMDAAGALTAVGATDLARPGITLAVWAVAPLLLGWVAFRSRDA